MSERRVVFGPVLRRRVAPRTLRFWRVGVRQVAQTHEQAHHEGEEADPRSHYDGHPVRQSSLFTQQLLYKQTELQTTLKLVQFRATDCITLFITNK